MLLAQAGTKFQHAGGDAQEVTLCLTEGVGISDGDQNIDAVSLQAVTLADGSTAYIQNNIQDASVMEGQIIQLDDGSTAFVHHIAVPKEEPSEWSGTAISDGMGGESLSLEDGQAIQLEDGTTAYIQHTPKESYESSALQAVQLEDGSTAYIQQAVQIPQSNTVLSIQQNGRLSDLHVEGAIDPETISVLEQFTTKIEEIEPFTNAEFITNGQEGVVQMQILLPGHSSRRAVQSGEKSFQCSYEGCGKLYTTAHHLKVHERIHTGDKPYCCDKPGCGKKFATGYGLKSHIRTHTGEKPYCCQELNCKKSFKTSGDLQKHTRIHTGEKPFMCPYEGCGRSFTTSNICKVHVRTHTGERPYHCPEPGCDRAFASATNYKNHIRIHTGERPYVCTVPGCEKRFTEYSSLYKHHVVHTPCKPYCCNHCGKTYKQISTLAMHKRTAHNDSEPIEEEQEGYFEPPAEAIDDPSINDVTARGVTGCSEMTHLTSEIEGQDQAQNATETHEAVSNTITMVTQDGSMITLPASESMLSSGEVTMLQEDGTEARMAIMSHDLASFQTKHEGYPVTLLATSNGTQIAVELDDHTSLEEALRIASSLNQEDTE
ncbi:zinc finger protein 143a isoform X1 [Astyanax mexicanus]|uniref:Zinc finger protein 143 n=1 Tax=Astyanax mexicanus TaxID=7994 RepID=A0A8T2LE05_ASTMX|nr:zinc finger protein 143a isoform X1 [Astyanax mexicanus]KAG9267141.1 zinc finger protein 143 [Astyanax mexicanus]